MRPWVLFLVLLVGASLVEGKSKDDEEDSYGDELMDKKEELRKKSGSRRVRPSERPPRASAPTRVLKSQEEANCPIGCACNRTSVSCVNVDGDASLFQQIQPIAFPAMDTLVLTGNRFADISGSGLFGNKNEHDMLTLANFSDNRISAISQQTFINMPHLEYLYLSNNLIDKAAKNPFGILKKLRKLYLSKALKNSATTHLSTMFDARHNQLDQLESIDLSSNKIEKIDDSTFCKVNGVAELSLSKNLLSSFEVGKNCLNGLRKLELSGNAFSSFSSSLFDALPNLYTLDISDNPLVCDCDMKSFIEFAQKEDSRFLNQDRTVCASPQALHGKSIFRIKTESVCVPKSSNIFSNLFLLVLFGTVGFFIYRFYRHRIPSPAVFQFGRSTAPPATYREIGDGGRIISRDGSPEEEDSIFENPLYTFDNPAWAR